MTVLLGVLLLAVGELAVLVEVARAIGVLPAIVLLLVVSASGPWLVRRAGFATWRRFRERVGRSEVPGRELLDSALLLAAGVLIMVPGFITDAAGLLLLLPPVRALVRALVARRVGRRVVRAARFAGGSIVSTGSHETPSSRPPGSDRPAFLPPTGGNDAEDR